MHLFLCRVFGESVNQSPRQLSLANSPDLAPCKLLAFLKTKISSLWKGRDFRPLMWFRKMLWGRWWWYWQRILQSVLNSGRDAGRAVWSPKVPTLKGPEASLFFCPMFLVSYIFFNKCLDFSEHMAGYFMDRPLIIGPSSWYNCETGKDHPLLPRVVGVFLETLWCFRYSTECFMGINLHILPNINYCFLIFPLFYSSLGKNEATGGGLRVPQIKVLHTRFKPKAAKLWGLCHFPEWLGEWRTVLLDSVSHLFAELMAVGSEKTHS